MYILSRIKYIFCKMLPDCTQICEDVISEALRFDISFSPQPHNHNGNHRADHTAAARTRIRQDCPVPACGLACFPTFPAQPGKTVQVTRKPPLQTGTEQASAQQASRHDTNSTATETSAPGRTAQRKAAVVDRSSGLRNRQHTQLTTEVDKPETLCDRQWPDTAAAADSEDCATWSKPGESPGPRDRKDRKPLQRTARSYSAAALDAAESCSGSHSDKLDNDSPAFTGHA